MNAFLNNPSGAIDQIKIAVTQVQQKAGLTIISEQSLTGSLEKITAFIPSILNSTANLITNLAIMLFFLYYMLYYSREMEKTLVKIIPLKDGNTTMLAAETKKIVRANALGIPLISLIQGLTATPGLFYFWRTRMGPLGIPDRDIRLFPGGRNHDNLVLLSLYFCFRNTSWVSASCCTA